MDKFRFYSAFHVALAAVCFLLGWPIFVLRETAEYYEESAGIPYSKLLLLLTCLILMQSAFAVVEALLPLSLWEREQIPEPELRLLFENFWRKFLKRNVRIVSTLCCYLFFSEWFDKGRDGVVKRGMPFLVVFVGLQLYDIFLSDLAVPSSLRLT